MGYWKALYEIVSYLIKAKILRVFVLMFMLIVAGLIFINVILSYMGINIVSVLLSSIVFFFLATYTSYKFIITLDG